MRVPIGDLRSCFLKLAFALVGTFLTFGAIMDFRLLGQVDHEMHVDIFLAQQGLLDDVDPSRIHDYLKAVDNVIRAQCPEIYENLSTGKVMSDETQNQIAEVFSEVKEKLDMSADKKEA